MNIVCATDDNFAQHCAVTIVSILKNKSEQDIAIYLLTEGISNENEKILQELASKNGGILHIILVDAKALEGCPMPQLKNLEHISIATYYRLLIPKLLPVHIEKVIYLDCDIVVRHSLDKLWHYPIYDYAIGAVYQISARTSADAKRLKYPASFGYFNAGVLLINLDYWRKNQISEKLFEFLNNEKETIIFHDQDALNGVLYDRCLPLPIKWNMLTIFFMKRTLALNDIDGGLVINNYNEYKKQILLDINDPSVIHFVSKPKPWDAMCDHPYRREYFKYLNYTPWRDYKVPDMISTSIKKPKSLYIFLKNIVKEKILGSIYLSINC